jgi:cytidyltransferase-like protein
MRKGSGSQLGRQSFKYTTIALGGTFDHIHKGHKALIARAFETGEKVFIGLTSDHFVRPGKKIDHDFSYRKSQLRRYLDETYPKRKYEITKLDKKFGKGMYTKEIRAIAVSAETRSSVEEVNLKRREMGLPDLKIEVIDMVLAEDGKRISSTRIRSREIDSEGRTLI